MIRPYRSEDEPDLRACFIELQDHEHGFDPSVPTGQEIVEPYVRFMLDRLQHEDAHILIAEAEGRVAGFASVVVRPRAEPDDPDLVHAEIAEIVVRERDRGRGLGAQLIAEAERIGKAAGATSLRIRVRAENPRAQALYHRLGFTDDYLVLSRTVP